MASREVVEVVILGKNNASAAFSTVATSLGGIATAAGAVSLGILAIGAGLASLAIAGTKTAISVESAFTGILKTTEGLGESFTSLTPLGEEILSSYRDLAKEIPLTLEELMRIGELAGQLAVPNEAIVEFTRTIADLGVSTNLTTESAAVDLARMANIYNITAGDMADNTSRMGSVIVDLGNNFATTESEIVDFATRLASVGQVAGFTQADVLAIGAAMSSVGVSSERGGTAVQKVLLRMSEAVATGNSNFKVFAETAGMTADEFEDAWRTSPAEAFNSFVQGLGAAGDNAFGILDELGLKDQRLIQAFLALAGAGDLLTDAIDMGSVAWEENSALAIEAGRRYATTESMLKTVKNQFRDIGLEIGSHVLPALQEFLGFAAPKIEEFGDTVAGALQGIVEGFTGFRTDPSGFLKGILPDDFSPVVDSFLGAFDSISKFFDQNGPGILASAETLFRGIGDAIDALSEKVFPFVSDVLDSFGTWFDENGDLIEFFFRAVSDEIVNLWIPTFVAMWDIVAPILSGLIDIVLKMVTFFMQVATHEWADAWNTFKEILVIAVTAIWKSFLGLLNTIAVALGGSLDEIKSTWSSNWNQLVDIVKKVFSNIVASITSALLGLLFVIPTIVSQWALAFDAGLQKILRLLSNVAKAFFQKGYSWLAQLAKGILAGIGTAVTAIQTAISEIMSNVTGIVIPVSFGSAGGSGGSFPSSIGSGSNKKKPKVRAAKGFAGIIPPGFSNDSFQIGVSSGEFAMVIPSGGFGSGNGPALAGAGGGGQVNVSIVYAPGVSFADEFEIEKRFTPVVEEVIRKVELRQG